MRRISFTLICTTFFLASQAQLSFGPKAGLNISRISFSSQNFNSSFKPGFYAGGFANYKLGANWAAQFEVFYSGEGGREKASDGTPGHINESYVQIPLLAQYHTAMGLFAEAGPQVGVLASIKEYYAGQTTNIKPYYKSVDFRFPFGIGYEFASSSPVNGLGVNARYSFSFSKVNSQLVGGEHLKNQTISIGVFYKIPMAAKK